MKAILYNKYGPPEVLQLKEVEKPSPRRNVVLVKVYTTTVTAGDVRMRSFDVPRGEWLLARLYLGIRNPRRAILGAEKRKITNSYFTHAAIFDERLKTEFFDAILAFNVLHLVEDTPQVLARINRLLKPGGFSSLQHHAWQSAPWSVR